MSRVVDIQTVSIAVASASVMVGVFYYILQLRHQSKVRQTDILLRIYSAFGSEGFQKARTKAFNMEFKDYNEFVKKYLMSPTGFGDTPENYGLTTVCVFYEGIGVLLQRKLIDLGLVEDLFGYDAVHLWERIKPAVEGWRKQFQAPRSMQQFEFLYNELKKREQKS